MSLSGMEDQRSAILVVRYWSWYCLKGQINRLAWTVHPNVILYCLCPIVMTLILFCKSWPVRSLFLMASYFGHRLFLHFVIKHVFLSVFCDLSLYLKCIEIFCSSICIFMMWNSAQLRWGNPFSSHWKQIGFPLFHDVCKKPSGRFSFMSCACPSFNKGDSVMCNDYNWSQ